jgi:hypothetical protein
VRVSVLGAAATDRVIAAYENATSATGA